MYMPLENMDIFGTGLICHDDGSIFRVSGPFWGESIRHRWSPLTKASDMDRRRFL